MSFLATFSICCSGIWIWRGRKRQVIDTRNLFRRSPGGKLVPLVIRNSFPTPTKQEMAMDSYAVSAKYYDDAYAAEPDLVDLLFYLDLAKQFGGPVLEIACGTGRILLPSARAGIEINGVDKSSSMLQVLREQLEREPAEIRNRVTISKGDMRTFRLSREFP